MIPNDSMDPLFEATVQATEEAILNALFAASTVTGYKGNVAYAITDDPPPANPPTLSLVGMLKKYKRYCPPQGQRGPARRAYARRLPERAL